LAASLTVSCKYDWLGCIAASSPSVDARFNDSMKWNESHGFSTIEVGEDSYKLYVMTDIHVNDGVYTNLDKFVSAYCNDNQAAPLALCLGDLLDGKEGFGTFMDHCAPIMNGSDTLMFTVGNHDLYFGRWSAYNESVHTSSYLFEVNTPCGDKDLYISIDSGNGTIGSTQRKWLENILAKYNVSNYRNIIVMTHTNFFMTDYSQLASGNYDMQETYYLTSLFNQYGVDLVLTGHDHFREDTTFKGVRYISVDALKEGFYAILRIGEEITVDYVPVN